MAADGDARSGAAGSNVEAVRAFYAAINAGSPEQLLALLSHDVQWDCFTLPTSAQKAGVPWLQAASGKEGMLRYLQAAGEAGLDHGKLQAFVPKQIVAEGDCVFTTSETSIASKLTGKVARMEGAYQFQFNQDGKISVFRHFVDTGAHVWVHTADEDMRSAWEAMGGKSGGHKGKGNSDALGGTLCGDKEP